jgi:LuxR family transcriptional regulator, maltose regulon positive regulatory protein
MTTASTPQPWGDRESPTSAKFAPPSLPRHLVRRDRLDRHLSLALQHALTIITGPPGAGKSVLLADWAEGFTDGVAAWLSLEEGDNEPGLFWRNVALALGPDTKGVASVDQWRQFDADQVIGRLLRQAPEGRERLLILDDFHVIKDEDIIGNIARLARRLPPHLRVILAGQGNESPSLQRVILREEAATVGDSELRFTVEECGALVALVARKFVPIDELTSLTERSEGWAAGLHLAALGLRDHDDPLEFVRSFSGSFGPVAEYLDNEMLSRQPSDIVRFLLQTSVLNRLTAELCEAVTGRTDCAQVLHTLARRNMFVVRASVGEPVYRYHNLFAELLRKRFHLEKPSDRSHAHFDAASWFASRGDVRSAAHHFAEAGAYERAFSLVFSDLVGCLGDGRQGESAVFAPSALTAADDEEDPGRVYIVAAALVCAQRVADGARALCRLNSVTAHEPDQSLWRGRAEFLCAVQAERLADPRAVLDHCSVAEELMQPLAEQTSSLEALGAASFWHEAIDASISTQLPVLAARAHLWLGQPNEAQRALQVHFGTQEEAERHEPALLALIACRQGRLRESYRLATSALQCGGTARAHGLAKLEALLALAEVLFEHNELSAAQEQLDEAFRLCQLTAETHWVWAVEVALVRLMLARDRPEEALSRLGHLREVGLRNPPPHHFLEKLVEVETYCRTRLGDLEGALLAARSVHAGPAFAGPLARIDMCSGRRERALARLMKCTLPTPTSEIRRLIQLACVELRLGHVLRGEDAMRTAVDAGRPEGYVRPFLEELPQSLALLRALLGTRPDSYLAHLLHEAERLAPSAPPGPSSAVVEPLTDRERQVLGYLPSHLSNREIAAMIYVSPNTVKSHLKGIYRKIGAASRTEAVTTARAMGLL